MITALLTAAALQMDPSAFAAACMAGGGAPGRVEASSERLVGRRIRIAEGTAPVTVMITVNEISRGDTVSLWVDDNVAMPIRAGGSGIVTGRRVAFGSDENQSFDYCLRLQQR